MRFRRDVQLDPSQVSDMRGRSFGVPAMGGGLGVIGLIVALVLGVNPFGGGEGYSVSPGTASNLTEQCQTGNDANLRDDCRIVGIVNSVQAFWSERIQNYTPATTEFFTAGVNTGCGSATSAVGPFYCSNDAHVYLDLDFFDQLRSDFGAEGGPFAEAYVVAHEYGHHVQDLLGTMERVRQGTGAESDSVRLELQADCFAGVWAANAVETGYIEDLTQQDIDQGLDAAAAVGDDRIQERATGHADPDSWTHGSSASRQQWFLTGFNSGNPDACNTFAASEL
jgi:predicted metalloprotease